MSVPPSFSRATLVTTLRAAGCVFAEDEAELLLSAASSPAALALMVSRRVDGTPLEHVVGRAEFDGLRIAVGPGVFVPRRRTEFLVRQAAGLAAATGPRPAPAPVHVPGPVTAGDAPCPAPEPGPAPVVVDLCCGSGALGAALAARLGRVELHAADVEPAAVEYARRNIGARGRVHLGDLFDPLPAALRGRVSVLLANVPYVPTGDVPLLPAEARVHEPLVALDGGADGLDVMRRVVAGAPDWLAPGGSLLMEAGARQAELARETVRAAGLVPRVVTSEEWCATVVIGTRPA
ncbi:methyltransferase [uncultured Streptomyces sp.]|uniref:methyltransferase n=1 Tax=uncultured Streptomyces sp. TaxID=174707 RepID=UPI00261853D1|nr:methyltransferase [uncultured Streptomyces sp.]